MHNLPFDKPGRFYRGNLHTHSTRSDGRVSPEQVCAYYRSVGYDFISITDHFMSRYNYPITDTTPYHTDDFATLLGAELHAGETIASGIWHLLGIGLPLDFAPPTNGEDGPGIVKRALDAGAYVAVAHPAWYNLTEADVISVKDAHAIEIINGISADHSDRIESNYMLDVMLAQGYRFHALATDDAHFHDKHHDLLRGWIHLKSESLEPDALLTALKAGHYYSSTGPVLHNVEVTRSRVVIECSPVSSAFVVGKGALARYQHGNGLRRIEFSLGSFPSDYCRVTVRDADGNRAWTNPIWFENPLI